MANSELTQAEADRLIALEKCWVDTGELIYPDYGGTLKIQLVSIDRRIPFYLDIRRARINLAKGTYQHRAQNVVVLLRLDFGGAPHRNPDGTKIGSPHLHRYRKDYGDRWAFPVSTDQFPHLNDPWLTLVDFMQLCHITEPPNIQRRHGHA